MKRILTLVLSLVLLVGWFTLPVNAEESITGTVYNLPDDACLYVREGAGSDYEPIDRLYSGEVATILGAVRIGDITWYKVTTPKAITGYASAESIQLDGELDPSMVVTTTSAFAEDVAYSITDNNVSGLGLAFCFTLNADGVGKNETTHVTDLSGATLNYEGEACKITRIGAVITNRAEWGTDTARFVRTVTQENPDQIKDVSADKMYKVFDTSCSFAIRVTNIPFEQEARLVYVRPYVEILCDSEKVTLYAETVASTSFAVQAGEPGVSTPYEGTDVDGKSRLLVGETAVIGNTLYLEVVDELDEWMTMYEPVNKDGEVEDTLPYMDYIRYACYDAEGNELRTEDKWFGILEVPTMSSQNATVTFEIALPEGTAQVKIVDANITYWSEWEEID